jgi:hypothetical protein
VQLFWKWYHAIIIGYSSLILSSLRTDTYHDPMEESIGDDEDIELL